MRKYLKISKKNTRIDRPGGIYYISLAINFQQEFNA